MWDCVRSLGYVVVLVAVGVLVFRVLRWVVGVLRAVFLVVRGVLWVVKVLLGGGFSW